MPCVGVKLWIYELLIPFLARTEPPRGDSCRHYSCSPIGLDLRRRGVVVLRRGTMWMPVCTLAPGRTEEGEETEEILLCRGI